MKLNYSTIKNWNEACSLSASLPFGTEQNCEGTRAETFLAGWVNAADMIQDNELDADNDELVLQFIFAEFDNMGYKR